MRRAWLGAAAVGIGLAGALSVQCGGAVGETTGTARAALRRAQSCEDLLAMVKADASAKMNARIDAQIASTRASGAFVGEAKDAGGAAPPSPAEPSSDHAKDYSDTNVQVAGVDEADVVKTDGRSLYVLHGQSFFVLRAWPAASLAIAGSAAIEGEPSEMFVTAGQAVVFSTVDAAPIFAAAGLPLRSDYGDAVVVPGIAVPPMAPGWYAHPLTKVTVLALSETAPPTTTRELYFEGRYVSSRRVGTHVRAVVEGGGHGPALRYYPDAYPTSIDDAVAALEALRRANEAAIDASVVSDWLPYALVRDGAGVHAAPLGCADVYVPTTETTEYGMTQIASLDLAAPADAARTVAIVGAVDTVYESPTTMVLAARAWRDPGVAFAVASGGGITPVPTASRPQTFAANADGTETIDWTHLHTFDVATDPSAPAYLASGTVAGAVDDQFSIDEAAGIVRVATTEQRTSSGAAPTRVNHLFTLAARSGALEIAGDAGELARGERIYSARFAGDRGYLVTFRSVDPLFVFDLTDPRAPKKLGEVTIPGFSTYMHPLDAGHLLTIGQDATAEGRVTGLALQIFDVTDGAAPTLADKVSFSGADYGYSDATYDHKAFTYFADRGLLAFPFVAYASGVMRSTCEVFHATVVDGITRLGAVDHSALFSASPQGFCGGYFAPYVRRGVFLESVLFSISYGGVVATDVADLGTPIEVLPLPAPDLTGLPYCGGV